MDYEASIQRALDYIEDHLMETLTLESLAEKACFSPYHFHRVFQAMVGDSVMEYVRKRRLTVAAERLFYHDEKVIDIALEVGFQYQESFNRAFKKHFGMSPKQYRKAEYLSGPFRGKVCLKPKEFQGGVRMEPKLTVKPAFHIIGYELKTRNEDGQNNRDIPEFWQQYIRNDLGANIPSPIHKHVELGLCTDFQPESGEFTYVIGMEVDAGTKPLEGMVYRSFPEQEYAVFTTPKADEAAFTASIQSTLNKVFTEWFPQSGYEHAGTAEFELYDERCYGDDNKEIDIYIPVVKKLQ
jgi:AraC family transcriptional regulator